jgi:hypothetical protein
VTQIKAGKVDMNDPASTVALLKANAVVGVTAFLNPDGTARSVGIQCALCHSTVDDSFAPGIGKRLDGWPNRDLNVGEIVALAPTLKPFSDLLGVDDGGVRKVLKSWGPGKYDAELVQDGKAPGPKGHSGATVLPAAFGLAGVNLHTYSGWGSVTYWNAYVANTQMHGKGTFFDPRLNDKTRFPIAVKAGHANIRNEPDLITSKLAALHFYQLAIPAPTPPAGSFDAQAAQRGQTVFDKQARCATCHVPPLFTEPGWSMHKAEEIAEADGRSEAGAGRVPEIAVSARETHTREECIWRVAPSCSGSWLMRTHARGSENLLEAVCGAREDRARPLFHDRPLNEIGMLHHEVHDLRVREIALAELQRLVDRLPRSQQIARRHLHLAKQIEQLGFRDGIDVVVHGVEVHAARHERGVYLSAGRAGWLLIDHDRHGRCADRSAWNPGRRGPIRSVVGSPRPITSV